VKAVSLEQIYSGTVTLPSLRDLHRTPDNSERNRMVRSVDFLLARQFKTFAEIQMR
jgi:hypothetical protein